MTRSSGGHPGRSRSSGSSRRSGRSGHGDPGAERETEYRIDELARLAGTTVRNVRAYQDRGLLPAPRRAGRVGLYAESHLARLRLIAELLGRGYTLANIAELVAGWEQGRELSEVLGLESALIGRWSEDDASTISLRDLGDLMGDDAAAALVGGAERAGLLAVDGDRVSVDNPRMLEGAAVLMGAGVSTEAVLDLGAYLARALDEVAGRYVEVIVDHVLPGGDAKPSDADLRRLATVVRQLRPLAKQVVVAELGLALERRIQAEIGDRLGRMFPTTGEAAAG
jgi:DNA-binding transcriptional MerR regulator